MDDSWKEGDQNHRQTDSELDMEAVVLHESSEVNSDVPFPLPQLSITRTLGVKPTLWGRHGQPVTWEEWDKIVITKIRYRCTFETTMLGWCLWIISWCCAPLWIKELKSFEHVCPYCGKILGKSSSC